MYGKGWGRVKLCGRKPESCAMRGLEGIYGRKPESGVCWLEYSYSCMDGSPSPGFSESKKDQDMLDSDSDSSDSESDVRRSEIDHEALADTERGSKNERIACVCAARGAAWGV